MRKLIILLFLFSNVCLWAQELQVKRSNNKVSLHGVPYYIHVVRPGENLLAISKAYSVPVDSIKRDNMLLNDAINSNQYLKIRVVENAQENEIRFLEHEVKSGDTPFNIAHRYGITIDDIYKFNPGAELSIRLGEKLKIPLMPKKQTEVKDSVIKEQKQKTYFYFHEVAKKESVYGIAAQYYTSLEELQRYNKSYNEDSVVEGRFINIPITEHLLKNDKSYFYYQIDKETVYSLRTKFQIKEKHLFKYNPILKSRGTQTNEYIKLPYKYVPDSLKLIEVESATDELNNKEENVAVIKETIKTDTSSVVHIDEPSICGSPGIDTVSSYKVAFFLPLYLHINDTLGKFIEVKKKDEEGQEYIEIEPREGIIEDKVYRRSEPFLRFYEGALLALQQLKKEGVNLEVHTFDTRNDSTYLQNFLKENDLSSFNLFIGPAYSEMIEIVNDYAWEHQINIVSPLSLKNDFIKYNPYAFQVSPPFEVQMKYASQFLNNIEAKNFIVIHDGKNLEQDYISGFKKELYKRMSSGNFDDFNYNEVLYYDARDSVLREAFTENEKNIVIVPSGNRAFVSDIMGKLNGYSYKYDILTFGQPRWINFTNIALDNFHNTNTHLFATNDIDYMQPEVVKFVDDFRSYFYNEPTTYSFLGYDVTYYFCKALNIYGHDFRKCLHNYRTNLLQSRFNFVPQSEQGGYQNTGIYIFEYTDDYKLDKVGTYPEQ